jgi:membrane-associated phospholipid phosphatase
MTPRDIVPTRQRLLWSTGQAGLVGLLVYAYFRIRNLTEGAYDVAVEHARELVAFEKELGIDVEHAIQAPVTSSETLERFANWVYIWGHWPVIIATMIWLSWRHRHLFLRLRDAMVISGALGMMVFVTYPVAPPRLVPLGLVDTVTENNSAYRVLQPPAFTNQYAAMPSLHAGWDLLVGIAIVTAATTVVLRVVGLLMPVLMMVAVVATANHFVIDVVAGVALVLAGHYAAVRLERRRMRRGSPAGGPGRTDDEITSQPEPVAGT